MHVSRALASGICTRSAPWVLKTSPLLRGKLQAQFISNGGRTAERKSRPPSQQPTLVLSLPCACCTPSRPFSRPPHSPRLGPPLTTATPWRCSPWPSSCARDSDGAAWRLRLAGGSATPSAEWPSACSRGWAGRRCVCRGTRPAFETVRDPHPTAARHQRPPPRHRHGLTARPDRDVPASHGRIAALPPGCCASSSASPALADRRLPASLSRLPALPSRCGGPSAVSPAPASPHDGRPCTLRRHSCPHWRAARARLPTGVQLKASCSASAGLCPNYPATFLNVASLLPAYKSRRSDQRKFVYYGTSTATFLNYWTLSFSAARIFLAVVALS